LAWTSPTTWESGDTERSVTIQLSESLTEVGRARHLLRERLSAWGVPDQQPMLELAMSELVTNAVTHGRGVVQVRIALDGLRVRLDVTDEGQAADRDAPAEVGRDVSGGWGLRLIDEMADAWGMRRDGGGTHVWMERRAEGWPHDLGLGSV
jgi:anti-sigma regulatory factor (Ser/Thr protein kinase)